MRPRTTYRTVPIGTSVAYTPYVGGTGSAIAYAPSASSLAYNTFGSSSIAYDSLGSGTIRSAEVIDDRAIGSTRSAGLVPEPDDLREAAREPARTASDADLYGKERYDRPVQKQARGDRGTATGGTPFRDRESRIETPARKSGFNGGGAVQPAPAANLYERKGGIRNAAPKPQSQPGTGTFDYDAKTFDDFDPSARAIPPTSSRYMRTSTSRTPTAKGWRASNRVEQRAVTKVPSRISMAKR